MINIDWNHLLLVGATAIGASVGVIVLFSLGIRLLTNAEHAKSASKKGNVTALRIEAANRAAAYALFAMSFGAVIFGILLIIPGLIKGA